MDMHDVEALLERAFEGDGDARAQVKGHFLEMSAFLIEAGPVLKRMAYNDHSKMIEGEYSGKTAEVAENLNLVRDRLIHIADTVENIGNGVFTDYEAYKKVGRRSENDRLVPGFVKALGALTTMIEDTTMLSDAAIAGKLETRANAARHVGEYRKIVEGINNTLDSVIGPLNVAADYVNKIGQGEIPGKITEKYNGDFNMIKNSLNNCIDGLQALVECDRVLNRMAVNDHSLKVDGSFNGIYATMAESTNLVRDRLLHIADSIAKIGDGNFTEYGDYKQIGRRSENDKIVPGFVRALGALNDLIEDTSMLSDAAIEGRLATRADAAKHRGEYRKIIDGINDTLDSVIGPVNEAMRVSQSYADQDFTVRFDPKVKAAGDFIRFKDALNNVGVSVSKAVGVINVQMTELSASTEEALASLNEVSSGANQIATNSQKVNENAERSMVGVAEVLKAMEDLSAAVEEVTSSMENVSSQAGAANEAAKNGAAISENLDKGMNEISVSSATVNDIVQDIEKQMADISKIVLLIRDLANQTNLLALNAAIEAARAGDAGRGFAVVASEVKSLAQESRGSAEKIEEMIGNLNKATKNAATAMGGAKTTVDQGAKLSKEAFEAFKTIRDAVEKVAVSATDVASAAEEQAATVEEITASVHEVRGQIENTTNEASSAAAATEEATASIHEVNKVVENVNRIVEKVSVEVARMHV